MEEFFLETVSERSVLNGYGLWKFTGVGVGFPNRMDSIVWHRNNNDK